MKLVFESVTLGKGIGISSLFSSLLLHDENKEIYQLSILTYVLIVTRSVLLYFGLLVAFSPAQELVAHTVVWRRHQWR